VSQNQLTKTIRGRLKTFDCHNVLNTVMMAY
jgi:hypothetical protein